MNSHLVTVVVPRLPPSVDGLGDYSLSLARQLRSEFNIETQFIVTDNCWTGNSTIEGFQVRKLSKRNAAGLVALLPDEQSPSQTVLLHYVGYGYAKRGSPVWLVSALSNWRKGNEKRKLVTMFHELYAFGPIWSSSFWTSPLQRFLAARLGRISNGCLTSKKIYADIIYKYSAGKHSGIPVLPVFSNIGEPENLNLLANRKKRIVVFGSRVPRTRVYKNSRAHLEKICSMFNIKEIIDVGSPLNFEIAPINGIPVSILGIKTSEEISALLADSIIGYINYPTEYLAKSGIFAAYCSHQVLPVVARYENQKIDSVIENSHYLVGDNVETVTLEMAQQIADNAHEWYRGHDLKAHTKAFEKILLKKD